MLYITHVVDTSYVYIKDTMDGVLHDTDNEECWSMSDVIYMLEQGLEIAGAEKINGEWVFHSYPHVQDILVKKYVRYIAMGKQVTFSREGRCYAVKDLVLEGLSRTWTYPVIYALPPVKCDGVSITITGEPDMELLQKEIPVWCDGIFVDYANDFGCFDDGGYVGAQHGGVVPNQNGCVRRDWIIPDVPHKSVIKYPRGVRILENALSPADPNIHSAEEAIQFYLQVILPDTVIVIRNSFCHIEFLKGSYVFPKSLVHLQPYAFGYSSFENISDQKLPEGLKSIGRACFERSNYIENIVKNLPSTLEIICQYAFSGANKEFKVVNGKSVDGLIDEIVIPASVKEIGTGAFYCVECKRFVLTGDKEIQLGRDCFSSSYGAVLVVPKNKVVSMEIYVSGMGKRRGQICDLTTDEGREELRAMIGVVEVQVV